MNTKRYIVKKLFCLLCMLIVLFSFYSCKRNTPETNDHDVPETNNYDTMKTNHSNESVKEFIALLNGVEPSGLISGYSFDEDHCYNVTPEQVAAETDMQIFKFSDSCASFVMLDNDIYSLCEFFGGYGFVNAVPCDFDSDGNKDLLVASSWGSGMHRSVISVFNSVSKESTVLYDTSTTDTPNIDLCVAGSSPSFSSKYIDDMSTYYVIYSVEFENNGNDFIDLSYVVTDIVGSIKNENGVPVFVPYQK